MAGTAGGASGAAGATIAGASGGAGGASGGTVSATEACLEYVRAQQVRRAECQGGRAEEALAPFYFYDQCPDAFFSDGSTRTTEGTLSCAETWKTFPCDQLNAGRLPACVTDGTRPAGEACLYGSQCASGDCHRVGALTCGACSTRVAPGAVCDDDGLICPDGYRCEAGTCLENPLMPTPVRELLPANAECGASSLPCIDDHTCRSDDQNVQRCLPPLPLGEACSSIKNYCEVFLYCSSDERCEMRPAEGEPCGRDVLSTPVCGHFLECDMADPAGPTCRTPPPRSCSMDAPSCPQGERCCLGPECATPICLEIKQPRESCADPRTTCIAGTECRGGWCEPVELQGLFDQLCMP